MERVGSVVITLINTFRLTISYQLLPKMYQLVITFKVMLLKPCLLRLLDPQRFNVVKIS